MKRLKFAISKLAALALLGVAALAQTNVASITGIVTDALGAVVPDAVVVITNLETGIVSRTRTNDAGVYFVSSLNPGRYRFEAQAQGFRRKQLDNLQIETGQKARLDLALEVGNVAEAVEIQGAAPLLQRETAEISETISAKEIRNLPLATRAPYNLLALSAGVVAGGNDPSDLDYSGAVSVNGSRTRGTAFVVDGASTTHIGGIGERVGSIEAIQEFKVLSSAYSAEYGRTSGGVITFQVKSGTQQFHGSAYEYYRSSAMGANAWENNARNVARPGLSSNIGIGNLGRNTSREPGYVNFDLSLFRNVPITERIALQFRVEAFNAFNHVNYREPSSTNIVNANYGLITAAAPPRRLQISARLSF
jgi:hypothetical protein